MTFFKKLPGQWISTEGPVSCRPHPPNIPPLHFFYNIMSTGFSGLKNLIIYARNTGKNEGGSELPLEYSTLYTQQTH
jgi:hypothetical protein